MGLNGNNSLVIHPPADGQVLIDGVAFDTLVQKLLSLEDELKATKALLAQSWRVLVEPDYLAFCNGPFEMVEGKGCRLSNPSGGHTCIGRFFSPGPLPYTHVTGSLTANQQGGAKAFTGGTDSITFFAGQRRLWSFHVGMQNISSCPISHGNRCPDQGSVEAPPEFGATFYCQSGSYGGCRFASGGLTSDERYRLDEQYYTKELFADFPPFHIELPPTTMPLEMRVCTSNINHPNRSTVFFHKVSLKVL